MKITDTIKEVRVIDIAEFRSMCIRNNFYTRGTCQEYKHLFDMIDKANSKKNGATAKDILLIAKDIYEHSSESCFEGLGDVDDDEVIRCILWSITNEATRFNYL